MINRPSLPLIAAMLALLTAIGLAAFVAWHQLTGAANQETRSSGEVMVAPGVSMGGSFELIDHTGRTVTDETFRGQFMLIYFGFTHCPDICPTELSTMAAAVDLLEERGVNDAEMVTPIFITVDPGRDTQAMMQDYVAAFHPRMVGLTGEIAATDAMARKYRVYYSLNKEDGEEFYLVDHTAYVYLMGPDGDFLTLFRSGTDAGSMADSLARYLDASPISQRRISRSRP